MKGLSLKTDAQFWEPQQSYVADGETPFIGDSWLTLTWDGEKDTSRFDWDRKFEYPFVVERRYSEIVKSRCRPQTVVTRGVAQPMSAQTPVILAIGWRTKRRTEWRIGSMSERGAVVESSPAKAAPRLSPIRRVAATSTCNSPDS